MTTNNKAGFDINDAQRSVNGIGTATIRLGEREYTIQERKRSTQGEWRKRFEDAFEAVSDLVVIMLKKLDSDIPGLKDEPEEEQSEDGVTVITAAEREQAQMAEARGFLISMLARANELVGGVLDQALDLVVSYSPTLERDRDYILSDAYDSQIVDALVEVLKLAYPFGSLITQLGKMGKLPGTGSVKSKT